MTQLHKTDGSLRKGRLVKNKGETLLQLGEASSLYEVGSHKPTALQFQHLHCFTQHTFWLETDLTNLTDFQKEKCQTKHKTIVFIPPVSRIQDERYEISVVSPC